MMVPNQNILGNAIKEWLQKPENKKKWASKKQELNLLAEILGKLHGHPNFYVPLRLACSVYLSQGSNNKNIKFPNTYEEFLSIWTEIQPKENEKSEDLSKRFTAWLNSRNNYRYAKIFGLYYAGYFKKFNPLDDYQTLKTLKHKSEIKKFWMRYDGVGIEYAKNIPMDELNNEFIFSIKIDSRLNSLLKNTPFEKLNNEEKEKVFLIAGEQNGLNGWEVDRICYNFKDDIKDIIKC